MSSIAVFNRQRKTRFDLPWLKEIADHALTEVRKANPSGSDAPLLSLPQIDVVIVSDQKIASIHEQFMSIADATDVITFEHGEIIISTETAQRNAKRYSQPLEYELALYIIHGLLHLHGYNDQQRSDAARMRQIQTSILKKCLKVVHA